jgi:ABC-2 type transport system permease protein
MSKRFVEWMPVAGWEIKRMLMRMDFVISTLLIPVIFVGIGFFMAWTRTRSEHTVTRIAVVRLDAGGTATGDSLPALPGIAWVTPTGADATVDALVQAVRAKQFEGAVVIPADYARGGEIEYVVRREHPGWKGKVEGHVVTLARLERAAGRGVSVSEFDGMTAALTGRERVAEPRSGTARGDRIAAMVMALFLATAIFGTNMYLAIGISGEKAARVTEVIVSAIRPQSWIDGKIVGYTVIGLVQPVVWFVAGAIAMVAMSWQLPPSMNPWTLTVFGVFTVLGFAFYVAFFALILATVKDLQSTQKFQAYLILVPMLPLFFIEPVLETPDATWIAVLSHVPTFSPVMMPMRVALGGAQPWEPALALVLLAAGAWLMRKAAGTAFRIGMLMYGKELTLPELVRWAKQG